MSEKIKTVFFGLVIVHPHSGKVSRAVVSRIVKHHANGYLGETDKQNAEKILKNGDAALILKDHNGKIELDHSSVAI